MLDSHYHCGDMNQSNARTPPGQAIRSAIGQPKVAILVTEVKSESREYTSKKVGSLDHAILVYFITALSKLTHSKVVFNWRASVSVGISPSNG